MTNEFMREERYIVFKMSDVERYLTDKDRANITMMKMEIDAGRDCANKPTFKGLIVEADWPEYEPTWKAIEARVTGAQPAPSVPDGWLRAIDEALVIAHIGVANAHDTYEQAKVKLDNLIMFHVDIATDPAVNGGFKLMPDGWEANLLIVEHAMRMNNWDWNSDTSDDLKRSAYKIISKLLAAQEDKS